ncbi:YaaR family protein [Fusibacter ferrireducens]|uniref:YaaR family protein n=1 Tax=Fusibacter ferrireducens TaxID=2785058 RepID=A0ABS0A024_9FIRM|nr:YaaR family protein [Fusibacter ferrireducens]MBF4695224.1 YaaR family protein [Fusibacter ferrireducens]
MKVSKTSKTSKPASGSAVKKAETSASSAVGKISFTEILAHKDYDQQKEALQKALDEIDRKGHALIENRTVESLFEYKKMIKDFIEETVHKGFEIRERRGFSRTGRNKVMRTVVEIDSKLTELTDLILKREHKEINILKKVGEIQGLLINLII